jgi:hypothetical protein
MRTALVIALLSFATVAAGADPPTSDAKAHFSRATAHFAVGEFAEAAEEYQAAYMAKQDPALLYNAAQAYRLAGKHQRALILYKNYVQLYPNESNIGEVKAQIAKLNKAIAASDTATTSPPTSTARPHPMSEAASIEKPLPPPSSQKPAPPPSSEKPAPPPVVKAPPVVTTPPVASTPPVLVSQPAPIAATAGAERRTPVYKKWWFWTIIGGVVVAGAVAGGVVASQSHSWNNLPDIVNPRAHALVQW